MTPSAQLESAAMPSPHEIANEAPEAGNGGRFWKTIVLVVSGLLICGTAVGIMGRAFYVTRDEYTGLAQTNAVAHENIKNTLDHMNANLNRVAESTEKTAASVQTLQVDMALTKPR